MNRKGVLRFMFVFMLLLLLPFTISKAKDFPANPIEKAGYKLGFNLNGNFTDRKDNNFNMDRIYVSNNDSLQKFESRLTGR